MAGDIILASICVSKGIPCQYVSNKKSSELGFIAVKEGVNKVEVIKGLDIGGSSLLLCGVAYWMRGEAKELGENSRGEIVGSDGMSGDLGMEMTNHELERMLAIQWEEIQLFCLSFWQFLSPYINGLILSKHSVYKAELFQLYC